MSRFFALLTWMGVAVAVLILSINTNTSTNVVTGVSRNEAPSKNMGQSVVGEYSLSAIQIANGERIWTTSKIMHDGDVLHVEGSLVLSENGTFELCTFVFDDRDYLIEETEIEGLWQRHQENLLLTTDRGLLELSIQHLQEGRMVLRDQSVSKKPTMVGLVLEAEKSVELVGMESSLDLGLLQ